MRDQVVVLLFVAALLVLTLLLYRAYLRQPPARPATPRIARYFEAAIDDEQFWWICLRLCLMTADSEREFRRIVQHALLRLRGQPLPSNPLRRREYELDLMQLGLLRGGWAGRHPISHRPAIAIAEFRNYWIGYAAAIHELFHLIRDYLQFAPFERESELPGFRRIGFTLREEAIVWWKTLSVAPVGTGCILFGYGGVIFTLCVATARFSLAAIAR